jgi:hypothetical protein
LDSSSDPSSARGIKSWITIIGGYDDSGNADPLKITFIYKTGFTDDKDGRDFKHSRRHIGGPKPGKLSQETDNEASEKVQLNDDEARGDRSIDVKGQELRGEQSLILSHSCSSLIRFMASSR